MNKIILILIIIPTTLFSQGWEKVFGGGKTDLGESVHQTADGGYIILGLTSSYGNGWEDVYLIKTNIDGEILWSNTYGGESDDSGRSVQQTTDGGYIITGSTSSYGNGGWDVYLIKTDDQGDTLWTKTFGGVENDYGSSVQQTTDGGYIITGSTYSFGNGSSDVYLIKTNNFGDTLWTKTYGGVENDWGSSVHQTTDTGYIITGGIDSYERVYLIKTNINGDTLWTNTFGGDDGVGNSVQQTLDGGYIVAGYRLSGLADVLLIKTDSEGDASWTKTFSEEGKDYGYSVQETSDEGYIIVGTTGSLTSDNNVYLIKTDSNGDTIWTKTFGGEDPDGGYSVQQTYDEGYIITGYTQSFGNGKTDVYLIKTDEYGIITSTTEIPIPNPNKKLVKMFDLSGKEIKKPKRNQPYIESYSDGTSKKKMKLR